MKSFALTPFWWQEHPLDVHNCLQQHLLKDDFERDDYRATENCELVNKCLGGQVIHPRCRPRTVGNDFLMRAPGAPYHCHTCWLLLVNH